MRETGLAGKTAIVTGSGRGIGRAIAIELAEHGANVTVTARTQDEIDATVQTIREETPGTAISIGGDISDSDHVDQLFEETTDEFGELDILVNNAGISYPFNVTEDSLSEIYDLMEINLYAALDCAAHAARGFGGVSAETDEITGAAGRILNISSLAAQFGGPKVHYQMAKAGLEAMTRGLAFELASQDVLVNAIAPGHMRTDMPFDREGEYTAKDAIQAEQFQEYYMELWGLPQSRVGRPEEIAPLARLLVSPENTYITGQTIRVDGGLSISP
jgi:3-oxoacyl-[acyl-carrier protein] reductase